MRRSWKIDNVSKVNYDIDKKEVEIISRNDDTRDVDKVMIISAWRLKMLVNDYLQLFRDCQTYLYCDPKTKVLFRSVDDYIENMKKEGYLR